MYFLPLSDHLLTSIYPHLNFHLPLSLPNRDAEDFVAISEHFLPFLLFGIKLILARFSK